MTTARCHPAAGYESAGAGGSAVQIRDLMHNCIRVRPDIKVGEALRVMVEKQVDGVPVVDDRNQVVGILTYADLLRFARRHHPRLMDFFMYAVVIEEEDDDVRSRFERILNLPIGQVCTHHVVTCRPDDEASDVAGLMVDHRIKRVPVVNDSGALVGVVGRDDLIRAIWEAYTR